MSSVPVTAPPHGGRAPRRSLRATVLRLTAATVIAAVLVWSALFLDLVRKRGDTGAALTQGSSQLSTPPDGGQVAQAPAPVTTRTS